MEWYEHRCQPTFHLDRRRLGWLSSLLDRLLHLYCVWNCHRCSTFLVRATSNNRSIVSPVNIISKVSVLLLDQDLHRLVDDIPIRIDLTLQTFCPTCAERTGTSNDDGSRWVTTGHFPRLGYWSIARTNKAERLLNFIGFDQQRFSLRIEYVSQHGCNGKYPKTKLDASYRIRVQGQSYLGEHLKRSLSTSDISDTGRKPLANLPATVYEEDEGQWSSSWCFSLVSSSRFWPTIIV